MGSNLPLNREGYAEYFGLRADYWDNVGISNTECKGVYIWDDFTSEMDGSVVDMSCTYADGKFSMAAMIQGASGKYYPYTFTHSITDSPQEMTLFFVNEQSNIDGSSLNPAYSAPEGMIEKVGTTDFSSAFGRTEAADQVLEDGKCLHYKFINHNRGSLAKWENFIFEAKDKDNNYLDLRCDRYGWGDLTEGCKYNDTYDWDNFNADLDSATVDMSIYKKGTRVLVECTITTRTNAVRKYQAIYPKVSEGDLNCHLIVDCSYIEIMTREILDLPTNVNFEDEIVGYLDCSSAYLGASSAEYPLSNDGKGYEIVFKNLNDGVAERDEEGNTIDNYKNWILRCFNNDETWSLNFNLRADNEAIFANSATWEKDCQVPWIGSCDFELKDFSDEMNGATVDMFVWRQDNTVYVDATITTSTGKNWMYSYAQQGIESENCAIALSQEAALLDIISVKEYDSVADGIRNVKTSTETPSSATYSIAGQQVNSNYKGIVIKNGRKQVIR